MVATASSLSSSSPGLDLSDPVTYSLVKRMFYKRFSARVKWAGIDEDDGFQSVCLGLLSRQAGKSRFNPRRSSMSNYLYIAMGGICRNMADSARRRASHEEGPQGTEDDGAERVVGGVEPVTEAHVDELAAEMEVPRGMVVALLDGSDPFVAALDAGMDFLSAATVVGALGLR